MKALFWKEWRENLKWALLAAACVAGAMFYGLRADPQRLGMGYGDNTWQGLLSPQILLVSSFGFPLIAAAIGFLQILTELRRDQWAFLVHRPITRAQVFWGKALPGLLLYLIATVVPYLGVAWWASLPGSLAAPFDWRMAQAGMVDALTGVGFYFAALWTGISQGRWYGRRLLPLVAACYGAVASKGYQPLDAALQVAVLTLIALVPATLAAYQTFGIFKRESIWGKVCTVLAVLLAVGMLQSWTVAGWNLAFPPKRHAYTDYRFTAQGELVRVSQDGSRFTKVVNLDGKELKPPAGKRSFDWDDFLQQTSVNLATRSEIYAQPYRQIDRFFQQISSNTPDTVWYFVYRNSRFSGYDRLSKRLAGYIGPQGLAEPDDPEKAGHFSISKTRRGYQNYESIFLADDALFRSQLAREKVAEIYRPAPGQALLGGTVLYERMMDREKPNDFATATDVALQAHRADGSIIWSFPQPDPLKKFSHVSVSRLPDQSRYFLLYQPDYREQQNQGPLYFELLPDGTVADQRELPKKPVHRARVTLHTVKYAILAPFGQTIWQQIVYALWSPNYTPVWKASKESLGYTLAVWAISIGAGLVCALCCLPLVRSITPSRRGWTAWLLFLLFYGVAGVVVFLIVNDWPRRIACPSCRKRRSIESPDCPHCAAAWAKPKADETEIFENLPA